MPSFAWEDDYTDWKCRRAREVKAKLKKLGLDPRSTKYNTLFFRWMRKP